jgi:hypothetical protein
MRRPWAVAVALCLTLVPGILEAQARTCRQVLPSDFRRLINPRGEELVYFGDPVRFLCTGGVRLEADSAVVNRVASSVELVGRVVYRDSTRELTADWANYVGRMDQLLARGSTEVRDLRSGALVEGENLNYLRENEERSLARMIVTGGRPHAVLPPEELREGPPRPDGEDAAVATEVWADRIELEGESIFRGQGDVEIERGDVFGGGRTAVFDQAAERMTLTERAFVDNGAYRLQGSRIDAFLEGDGLREVLSDGAARVTSEDLDVRAQRIRIAFVEGEVEGLEAWNPDPDAGTPRARAEARDFRLRADSIHAQADSLGIRELRAVGRAYGERDAQLATSGRTLPIDLARDWIQGDTVLAFFIRAEADPGTETDADTDAEVDLEAPVDADVDADVREAEEDPEVVLERIVVVGGEGDALSLYRTTGERAAAASLNFMRAARIVLFMEQGAVARVEAIGPIEGLYLEPTGGTAREGEPAPAGADEAGR